MKKIYRSLLGAGILATAAVSLVSCDEVKPDDRYIEGPEITAERAVLLEDFTGQMCLNCPAAHEVIEQLEEQYGKDKVIAVSIHSGALSLPVQFTSFDNDRVGLMTAEGNAIMESYGIETFPMGVINMGSPEVCDLWATSVREALQQSTDVTINLETSYTPNPDKADNGNERYGTIGVKATVKSGSSRNANIQFWIVENGIVAQQRNGRETVKDYVHNNVFRAQMLNGLKGEAITLTENLDFEKEASIPIRWTSTEHWVLENLSVVAFVSDNTGVLQVVRVPLVGEDETEE